MVQLLVSKMFPRLQKDRRSNNLHWVPSHRKKMESLANYLLRWACLACR